MLSDAANACDSAAASLPPYLPACLPLPSVRRSPMTATAFACESSDSQPSSPSLRLSFDAGQQRESAWRERAVVVVVVVAAAGVEECLDDDDDGGGARACVTKQFLSLVPVPKQVACKEESEEREKDEERRETSLSQQGLLMMLMIADAERRLRHTRRM